MAPGTDLLPLAEGGKLLGGDKNTEFEDGLQLGGKPFGLKVLELGLGLPDERHIQAQAEHAGGRGGRCSAATGHHATTGASSGRAENGEDMPEEHSCHWLLKPRPFA